MFDDVIHFLLRIVNGKAETDRPMSIISDPMAQEWMDFRCRQMANYYGEMEEYIRGLNPEVTVENNPHGLSGQNTMWDILGRKFARGGTTESPTFLFDPDTGKIDMRIEEREARLKFESNVINGNFEMGRLLLTVEYGDERP
jgi:hypothetical protein